MSILKSSEKRKLSLKRPLVTTFSERRAFIFKKYVAEDTKSSTKQFKPDELLWLHSSVFTLEF